MPFPFLPTFPTPPRRSIKASTREHMKRRVLPIGGERDAQAREEQRRRFRTRCFDRMSADRRERLDAGRADSIRRVLQEEWVNFQDEASLDPEWLTELEAELIAEHDEEVYAHMLNSEQEALEAEVAMYEQQTSTSPSPPVQASQLSTEHGRICPGPVLWTWDAAVGWIMLCNSCDICLAL
ncbi:hypothetical protein BJ684DRAFT_20644 [Piptocephalis cylindrospora]|uniref:RPA-interacting protein N-terminal domain-containing protein n=1 Tax=Piptocephalis cylindrospora TaxID=1907219 RepID=A0A4P9Y247_9FUNG|nr:hypothetical protein BJ684DRAFT_20644 [Piptocephalis cylindrospora]|eukprot:RKP12833.1 hypothetical protein BJ684DRAFT_20644 [Piptocephalis cylindrospora]